VHSDCFSFFLDRIGHFPFRLRIRNGTPTEEEANPPPRQDRRTNKLWRTTTTTRAERMERSKHCLLRLGSHCPALEYRLEFFAFLLRPPFPLFVFCPGCPACPYLYILPPHQQHISFSVHSLAFFSGCVLYATYHYHFRQLPRSTTWVTCLLPEHYWNAGGMAPNNNRRYFDFSSLGPWLLVSLVFGFWFLV
jgi:hypothetical protein